MNFENENLTYGQRKRIYQEMLVPIKSKISQIILYDTEAAQKFLQKYNEIVKDGEKLGMSIISEITKLDFEIQEYERSQGKEKAFEERSKAVLQSIEDLKSESVQLNVRDFEMKVAELRRKYKENIQNYSFKDRERIEEQIYDLQAILIMRQVSNGSTTEELQQDIDEQDKIGLEIWVNGYINRLMQEENSNLRTIGNKIRNIIMTDQNAVRDVEIWKWLDSAMKGKELENQKQENQTTTAMAIAPKKRSRGTIGDKISRFFSKEPILPLQIEDLGKMSINWLGQYIPKIMLQELEDNRLKEEGVEKNSKYLPDPRAPIYQLFKVGLKRRSEQKVFADEYQLVQENGSKINVEIKEGWEIESRYSKESMVKMEVGDVRKGPYGGKYLIEILRLAGIIDKTFNTDFQQQLLNEIKEDIDGTSGKNPVYTRLRRSWKKMRKEYEKTALDFEAKEKMKRETFYKKYSLLENIKVEGKEPIQDNGNVVENQQHQEKTEESQGKTIKQGIQELTNGENEQDGPNLDD